MPPSFIWSFIEKLLQQGSSLKNTKIVTHKKFALNGRMVNSRNRVRINWKDIQEMSKRNIWTLGSAEDWSRFRVNRPFCRDSDILRVNKIILAKWSGLTPNLSWSRIKTALSSFFKQAKLQSFRNKIAIFRIEAQVTLATV